jgi:hypothetical protein
MISLLNSKTPTCRNASRGLLDYKKREGDYQNYVGISHGKP